MKRFLILLTILLIIIPVVTGQTSGKKRYQATRITKAPEINGILDEEIWNLGEWVDDFTQNQPYSGRPATQRTEFKILFDEDNLYVAIKAFDTSPDSIISRLSRRDQVDGDLAGIIIDSFHDLRTGFLFGVSAAGVKYDQMFTNDGQNQDGSWDPNWWAGTSINKEGWIAEMKIPFSQVRFEKNSGDVWGMEIARIIYRNNEQDFWQDIPRDAPGFIHMMGEMSGIEKIKPRKIFDITPYGVAKVQTFKKEPGNPFRKNGRNFGGNAGIDAKIGITNNMTMDLTINPDFGQIEADPSEVNLSAYETYFSEKRPFFIEGNNITNFNLVIGTGDSEEDNLFYSRRIGRRPEGYPHLRSGWNADIPTYTNILGAAKLTGKTKNGLSVGFVEGVTAEEKAEIDTVGGRIFETVEPLTNYLVGRIQRDFKEGNTILGGIVTGTYRDLDANLASFMHKAALSGGIDFTQYFNKKNWMFNLTTAFSQVTGTKEVIQETQMSSARYFQRPDNDYRVFDPDRSSLAGTAGRMQMVKLNGHWNFLACVKWKSPGYEINDLGYMTEADQVFTLLWAGYNQWEPKSIYQRYNINGSLYYITNFGGDNLGEGFQWNASMGLKNYWSVWTGGNINSPSISTGMLRGGPMIKATGSFSQQLGFSTDYRKKLGLEYFININRGFEDSYHNLYTEVNLSYKPINYLSISIGPGISKSFTELQYVTRTTYNNLDRYIFASIDRKTINASLRINFNLSPDLTFQYWGQPFVASGNYYDYKYISNPLAADYKCRFHVYTDNQISSGENGYNIDEQPDGTTGYDYSFDNKNFNFQQFLSNLVLRWEYNPGSSVYLVWNQTRDGYNPSGMLEYFDDMGDLFNHKKNKPNNVFLIKFSYRFGLK
jgi:hypothetical protein